MRRRLHGIAFQRSGPTVHERGPLGIEEDIPRKWRTLRPRFIRVVERKRHVLTDTDGRLLLATVSPADLHDSHAGVALLKASRRPWPFLAMCFADRAYTGERVAGATPVTVAIVSAPEGQKGFAVHPRRWVIERTLGWISRCRRLARDHEATPSSALAFLVLAAAMVLVRRLARHL